MESFVHQPKTLSAVFPLVEKPCHTHTLFSCANTGRDEQRIDQRISFTDACVFCRMLKSLSFSVAEAFAVSRTDCLWNWKAVWPFTEEKKEKKTRKSWSWVWGISVGCLCFLLCYLYLNRCQVSKYTQYNRQFIA